VAAVIAAGGVALLATDTVYGLACDATDAAALERLLELKGRPPAKPTAVAFANVSAVIAALPDLGERSRAAVSSLLPGPVTLLLANPAGVFPLAGGGQLLGVRVFEPWPDTGRPVLLTSANRAGETEARTLAAVPASIRSGVDIEIDGGELAGVPSTVVDLGELEQNGRWRIVRPGALAASALERALVGS
jgi:L-threonylcarbamoyladenylate synthase